MDTPKATPDLRGLCDLADRLAKEAGALAMSLFGKTETRIKQDGSEVTEADRRAETFIRGQLEKETPWAQVLGEEFGGADRSRSTGDQWIVDPIDGTASFVLGLPLFGTLIGLQRDGNPVLGVVHFPGLDETLSAIEGGGCWFEHNDESSQVRSSGQTRLADAFVSTSGFHGSDIDPREGGARYRLTNLVHSVRRHRPVLDCVQHAMVARGRLDLAVDSIMSPWDIAALLPCLTESGAAYACVDGRREDVAFGGSLVSAATEELLEQALRVLAI